MKTTNKGIVAFVDKMREMDRDEQLEFCARLFATFAEANKHVGYEAGFYDGHMSATAVKH